MYQLKINDLTQQQFLAEYWQKKPLLIKQGFSDFIDPIDADELAGLAMEDSIESRIITNHNDQWVAHQGPFSDFSLLSEQHSTLLVQAVDHWHETAAQLLEPFRFIPNWRIDDLMISFSTPHGGVGPHLDQYDVFIVQGQGKRHWRVGAANKQLKQFTKSKILLQVEQFPALIDCILEPGDILYIPPGCPHEGYAVENALNYSIGFRAPNQQDLLSSFADHLIDNETGQARYSDTQLKLRDSMGELTDNEANEIKQLMLSVFNDDASFKQWLGRTLSQAKHEMDLVAAPAPLTTAQLTAIIQHNNIQLIRLGGTRAMYQHNQQQLIVSINGENYILPNTDLAAVKLLTDQLDVHTEQLSKLTLSHAFIAMLTELINQGLWFEEE